MLNGKQLKRLVSKIPDDAIVQVAGPDSGGYDWTYCDKAQITKRKNIYFISGVFDERVFKD
jgi:hypothetical protein